MRIKTLQAEQMLMDRLRAASRDILGPDATEAEVEADAKRAYEGPEEPYSNLQQKSTKHGRSGYRRRSPKPNERE